jgi:hypothetical protein
MVQGGKRRAKMSQYIDPIWTLLAFILTIFVLSYILGNNPFFKAASYILVGVTAGYLAVMAIDYAILPRLIFPLISMNLSERNLAIVPLILGLLMLTKLFPRFSSLGRIPVAYLAGAGAAVAIGGAVLGTGLGQVKALLALFNFVQNNDPGISTMAKYIQPALVLLGTITTLVYFQFGARSGLRESARRAIWIEALAGIGKLFIALTLGAVFAGVYLAAVAALVDRVGFLWQVIMSYLPGLVN